MLGGVGGGGKITIDESGKSAPYDLSDGLVGCQTSAEPVTGSESLSFDGCISVGREHVVNGADTYICSGPLSPEQESLFFAHRNFTDCR